MDVKRLKRDWTLVTGILAAGLTACGGGGSAPPPPPPPPPPPAAVSLSGTAAAGLPLVGTVTVKDALGATKTVPIDASGGYTVDVTGMTAPVMLRATGSVGATSYVVHSASASIAANGTVNITPLTDLIVANAAGQIAATYFAGSSFAKLTQAELDAETAGLRAKLLPVLQAMNVDASIDLLRTPFTPLSSALDKALDVLRVSVDASTQVATITNLVNQIAITDNLAIKAAAEAGATPMAATGMGTTAADLVLIRKALTDVFALFATALPQPAQVLPLLSGNFLHQDTSRANFANGVAQASQLVGASLAAFEIRAIDYNNNGGANPVAHISFVIKNRQGIEISRNANWKIIKGSDGVWRAHGDQRVFDLEGHTHIVKDSIGGCLASGIEFNIHDNDSSNSATIDHLMISGPGLPAGGVRYQRTAAGDQFTPAGTGNPFWLPFTDTCNGNFGASGLSDAAIGAIPDFAAYTIAAFAANNTSISIGANGTYTELVPKRPMTRAEVQAATTFPTITAPTAAAFASYAGGSLAISGSGVDPARSVWLYLGLTLATGLVDSVDTDLDPTATGGFSGTPSLATPAPGSVTRREIRVATKDAFDRTFMTIMVK